jgi:hypothetical protein
MCWQVLKETHNKRDNNTDQRNEWQHEQERPDTFSLQRSSAWVAAEKAGQERSRSTYSSFWRVDLTGLRCRGLPVAATTAIMALSSRCSVRHLRCTSLALLYVSCAAATLL